MSIKWEEKRLKELCETGAGGTPLKNKKEYYEGGNIPWIRSREVNNKNITDSEIKITQEGLDNSSAKLFPPRTVVIAMYGATAGQVGILNFECSTNQAVCGIFPNEKFVPEFLYYKFLDYKELLISQAVGGAQPNISQAKIKETLIPNISLQEQKQIVALLDKAFEAIDKAKANIEQNIINAKELFQSKLNEIFNPQKRGTSVSTSSTSVIQNTTPTPKPTPEALEGEVLEGEALEGKKEGWEEKKLKEITTKIGSGATPRGGQASYKESGISLIRSMNVYDEGFKEEKLAFIDDEQAEKLSNVTIEEGDVLFNITGASIARCCVVPSKVLPARVNQHVTIIRPKSDLVLSDYLQFLLTSKNTKNILLGIGEQGSTRQAITKAQMENFVVRYPQSVEEQKKVVENTNYIKAKGLELEKSYQAKLNSLEELKKSILQKAFAGELTSTSSVNSSTSSVNSSTSSVNSHPKSEALEDEALEDEVSNASTTTKKAQTK